MVISKKQKNLSPEWEEAKKNLRNILHTSLTSEGKKGLFKEYMELYIETQQEIDNRYNGELDDILKKLKQTDSAEKRVEKLINKLKEILKRNKNNAA